MSTSTIYNVFIPYLFVVHLPNPLLSQHRSLQPTGPPAQGPSQSHSHARLNESLDNIRAEFDNLAAEVGVARAQKDEFETKGTIQNSTPSPLTHIGTISHTWKPPPFFAV